MAKALYGHVGAAPDRRLLDEVTRLRARVQALEFEITQVACRKRPARGGGG